MDNLGRVLETWVKHLQQVYNYLCNFTNQKIYSEQQQQQQQSHLVALLKHFKRSNLSQKILNYMDGLKGAILAIF